jgi:hypothetical protein
MTLCSAAVRPGLAACKTAKHELYEKKPAARAYMQAPQLAAPQIFERLFRFHASIQHVTTCLNLSISHTDLLEV